MLFNKLVFGVLAIEAVSAVTLADKKKNISSAGTEWQLKKLNEEVGNLKWERPHEKEHFDLGDILHNFYDQVGMKFGDKDYGTFSHHGAYYKYGIQPLGSHKATLHDWDYGLKDHGTPENVHNHFDHEGGKPKTFYNPFLEKEQEYSPHHSYGEEKRPLWEYTIPEVHYPAPKPYSYSVDEPTIQYREVEHVRPPKYETPVLDIKSVETYPEGYTNEYDNAYIENYFGSDGSDHAHYMYDNYADIQFHGHQTADPFARSNPLRPEVDNYFIPQVVGPSPKANYSGSTDKHAEAKKLTYTDPTLGLEYYLFDNSLVPGQAYKAQNGSHHDDYLPTAYVELEDGSVIYSQEEHIPTEVIYGDHATQGASTVREVDTSAYPAQQDHYPAYLNEALSFDFMDDYTY